MEIIQSISYNLDKYVDKLSLFKYDVWLLKELTFKINSSMLNIVSGTRICIYGNTKPPEKQFLKFTAAS